MRKAKLDEVSPPVDGLRSDNKSEWLRLSCEYIIHPNEVKTVGYAARKKKWLDECTFAWRVILARDENGSDIPDITHSILLAKNIHYGNVLVRQKQEHLAVVYIEPQVIKRYWKAVIEDGIFVELQIKVGEKTRAIAWARNKGAFKTSELPPGFFPNPEITNWFASNELKTDLYGLKSRLETPWAWSSYGSYEAIVP